jgi:hypothetical protein
MIRPLTFESRRWFDFVPVTITLFISTGLSASEDFPTNGPPPIEVTASVGLGRVLASTSGAIADLNDGWDRQAELELIATFNHQGHGSNYRIFNVQVDLATTTVLPFGGPGWSQTECSPKSPLLVNGTLTEIDISQTRRVVELLGLAGGGAALALLGVPFWPFGLLVSITAVSIGAIEVVNGNDSFGGAHDDIPENGIINLPFNGPIGSAEVSFQGRTFSVPPNSFIDCLLPETPTGPTADLLPSAQDQRALIFDPIMRGLEAASGAEQEPGISPSLTEQELRDIRDTFTSTLFGVGEIAALLSMEAGVSPEEPGILKVRKGYF